MDRSHDEELNGYIEEKEVVSGKRVDFEFKPPFTMVVGAPTDSGKSYLLIMLLRRIFVDMFDTIYILSGSIHLNTDFDEFENVNNVILISHPTTQDLDNIIDEQELCKQETLLKNKQAGRTKFRCPRILVYLDDILDSGVARFTGAADTIAARGRHMEISMVVSTQRIKGISVVLRDQSKYIFIFELLQGEIEKFMNEFVPRSQRKPLVSYMTKVFRKYWQFLMIDTRRKGNKIFDSNADDIVEGTMNAYSDDLS